MEKIIEVFLLTPVQYAEVGVIVLILAIVGYLIARNESYPIAKSFRYIVIPILPIFALLFGENEAHDVRIHTVTVLMLSYCVLSIIVHLIGMAVTKTTDKKKAHESGNNAIPIQLPLEATFMMDAKFAEALQAKLASLNYEDHAISMLTQKCIRAFNDADSDDRKELVWKSYFCGICYHISNLFSFNTRVHVRILSDVHYQKYVATYEHDKEYKGNMTNMSLENKMIQQSYENNCSLVKSLNPKFHEAGSNKKWKDYLTFTLAQFVHEDHPIFSFGISITKNKEDHDTLLILNFCEIEAIISRHIDDFIESTNIIEFVDKRYFSHAEAIPTALASRNK